MNQIIKGTTLKFGDHINTDLISPPQYMELPIEKSAAFAMSALDSHFSSRVREHSILVAGSNFGSGSSRETSPLTLKYLGVKGVVAKSFARIFYRNAINVGLPVIECSDADSIEEYDALIIDLKKGVIVDETKGISCSCSRIPEHLLRIIAEGGLVASLRKEFQSHE